MPKPVKQIEWAAAGFDDPLAADIALVDDVLTNGDLLSIWPAVRELELQSFRDNFTSSAAADGSAWPPRKREGDGHPLLMDTGALLQAVTGGGVGHITRTEPRVLETGVDMSVDEGGIPGAAAHDRGFSPRNLPERQFHEIKEQHLLEIDEMMVNAFWERL